jgi:hypothetical protein
VEFAILSSCLTFDELLNTKFKDLLINGAIFKNACEIQVCSRKGN